MPIRSLRPCAVLLAASLLGTVAFAAGLSAADSGFMKQAAQDGHAEVEASKLAQDKAHSEQVKSFARQMIDDHTKAGDELKALAASKGVDVPDGPSVRQQAQLKLLGSTDGVKFDKRYVDQSGVAAHEETVKLFKKGASEAKDADVKAFAAKTLPTLEHHLQMARQLHDALQAQR